MRVRMGWKAVLRKWREMVMGMITIETRDCSWERDLAKQDKIMEAS
jgi:hypothetical protein